MTDSRANSMQTTRTFWNASPCGAQESFASRVGHRYGAEPWVMDVLKEIAAIKPENVLEIGCGQGTDAHTLCRMLPQSSKYIGIDYSDKSIAIAKQTQLSLDSSGAMPTFKVGDAECLEFDDDTFSFIYSNGVLHHTSCPPEAFEEVFRVLRPGGQAYIALYRNFSFKVGVAQILRRLQTVIDKIIGTDRIFYRMIHGRHLPSVFGTMFLECFGVPYMWWYTRSELLRSFSKFEITRIRPVGHNFFRRRHNKKGWKRSGYMWLVQLKKPVSF